MNDLHFSSGKSDCKKLTAVMQTIMNQLKGSVAYFLSQKSIADNLVQQRASLPNITFGPTSKQIDSIYRSNHICNIVYKSFSLGKQNYLELSQRHSEKNNELMLAVFIAEQNLYLLWIHLDFYFRNAVIYSRENRTSINETCLGKFHLIEFMISILIRVYILHFADPNNMSVLNASHDEIAELKQMLIYNLNETFCTQLITASEEYSVKCKNFNTALLRRIKSLVQFAPVA